MQLRPATEQDAQAAADLVIAGDLAEVGEADYSLGDLNDEWRELDIAMDTLIVEDDQSTIVGCAHFRGSDLLGFKARFAHARLPPELMPLIAFPGGYGGLVLGTSHSSPGL